MGRRAQIALVSAVFAAIAGVLLLYWWDTSYKDKIAEGVTIGGIDVGGLDEEGARSQIRTTLIAPLDKPVTVTYEDERFRLKPKQINIRADVEGMVEEALEASREGGLFGRTIRRIGGGEVDHGIEPQIAYSKEAVSSFVDGVAGRVDRDPVDATVEPSGGGLQPVSSRVGYDLDEEKLRREVERALQDPAERKVEAKVEKLEPEVTTDQLASAYPHYLTVDRSGFRLRYYENLKLSKTYTVAIGAIGYDTPAGLYHIQNKQTDPTWYVPEADWAGKLAGQVIPPGPDNPLKARWMGFYNGAGIHGTSDTGSLGSAASHGCIRMSVVDVKELYELIPTGTPIYIA